MNNAYSSKFAQFINLLKTNNNSQIIYSEIKRYPLNIIHVAMYSKYYVLLCIGYSDIKSSFHILNLDIISLIGQSLINTFKYY